MKFPVTEHPFQIRIVLFDESGIARGKIIVQLEQFPSGFDTHVPPDPLEQRLDTVALQTGLLNVTGKPDQEGVDIWIVVVKLPETGINLHDIPLSIQRHRQYSGSVVYHRPCR